MAIWMLHSTEHKISPANKSQITDNYKFFLAKHSWAMNISLLINKKIPTIVDIFIFINRENFMLSWVEHDKSFITSGLKPVHKNYKQCHGRRTTEINCQTPTFWNRLSWSRHIVCGPTHHRAMKERQLFDYWSIHDSQHYLPLCKFNNQLKIRQ